MNFPIEVSEDALIAICIMLPAFYLSGLAIGHMAVLWDIRRKGALIGKKGTYYYKKNLSYWKSNETKNGNDSTKENDNHSGHDTI